ncbi:MAG: hypothetical protein R2759_13735 [Bacteroidales bacterium]
MDAWLEEGFKEITPIGLEKLGFDTDEIMGEEIMLVDLYYGNQMVYLE